MLELGVSAEQIAALTDSDEENPDDGFFEVWPENWLTVQVWMRCADSWDIVSGLGGVYYQGLKSARIETVLRLMQIPESDKMEIFDDLITMSAAAREVLNGRE